MVKQSPWILHTLLNFEPGQIQAGDHLYIPHKVAKPPTLPYGKPYDIVAKHTHVKGTGIPSSTIARFQKWARGEKGGAKPGGKSLQKLREFAYRHNYARLRALGASPKDAKHLRGTPPAELNKAAFTLQRTVAYIVDTKGIDPIVAAWGCAHSWRSIWDWDQYTGEESSDEEPDDDYDDNQQDAPDLDDEDLPF